MSEGYAVYLGKPCVDAYYEVSEWPEEGGKFLGSFVCNVPGGMVANAACVLAGYDYPVYLFAAMGDDEDARFLMEDLESYGVDVSMTRLIPGRKDTKCFIFRSGAERTILVAEGDKDVLPLTEEEKDFLLGAEYIYTIIPDIKSYEGMAELLEEHRRRGGKLVMDCETTGYTEDWREYLQLAHLVFMNTTALEKYAEGQSTCELEEELMGLGTGILVETLGSKGSRVVTAEASFPPGCTMSR
ncbi:MAG: carbohydrate kinase family protein [Oscillospiraceae bacterium]|nr:carbohydrate kinase family protein [Oscillospiraceae bacterium]